MDWNETISKEADHLRQIRDELRVQLHLGREEVKDEWERLERSWHHLEGRLKVLREQSKDSLEEVGEAAKLLVDEIREGYRELRKLV